MEEQSHLEAHGSSADEKPLNAPPVHPQVVDETYFHEYDGDCVFLVGGVFFKVHRHRLTRDSSIFKTMFNLPLPVDGPKQGTMENPIILQDDPEEFRALCWILYALPLEICSQCDVKQANITRLVSLARICRKYQFGSIEQWTLGLLTTHINPQSPCQFLDDCPAGMLTKMLELSALSDLKKLEEWIIEKWLERIRKGQLDIPHALTVAERLNLRNFQGSLYYAQLLALSGPALQTSSIIDIRSKASKLLLTPDQQNKLYAGAWLLSLSWIKINDAICRVKPRELFRTVCGRPNKNECPDRWDVACRKSLALPFIDEAHGDHLEGVRQMLKAIEEKADNMADLNPLCAKCRQEGIKMVKAELEKFQLEMSLAEYFLGVYQ
ncbi:hypothetical protein AX16_004602 [Volvariella volvacea WC 439]|nr:hypothetical protein AX16_004602 [Volvariella volvacea WC 439]